MVYLYFAIATDNGLCHVLDRAMNYLYKQQSYSLSELAVRLVSELLHKGIIVLQFCMLLLSVNAAEPEIMPERTTVS